MKITEKLFISFVIAGSSRHSVFEQWELESAHRPRFGRNWWFWIPALNNNGGGFKRGNCTDLSVNWLCFSLGLIWFR